jgi:ABC-2 type transport system permease protein
MTERGFLAAFLDEVAHFGRGAMFWWLLVAAPICAIFITTGLFQDGQMTDLPVAACDLDGTDLSRAFLRSADALPVARLDYSVQSEAEGLDLMRRGIVYGVVIIPRHFSREVFAGRPAGAIVYVDGQRMAVGSMLRSGFSSLSEASWRKNYVSFLSRAGIPAAEAQSMAATVSIDLRAAGNPALDYRIFLCHGFLPVLCSLMYLIAACAKLKTRHENDPASAFGRAAALACWMFFVVAALTAAQRATGTTASACSILKVWFAYGLMLAANCAQAVFICGLCGNTLFALMAVSAMASPAMAFAGLTFPVGYMSDFARWWAAMLPVTHAVASETAMASQGASVASQLYEFASMLFLAVAYGVLGFVMLAIRKRKENAHAA